MNLDPRVITDRSVVSIAHDAQTSLRLHRLRSDICDGPGTCWSCVQWAEMYLLAQEALPDLEQRLADYRTELLARDGGGTDWDALQGTVFAR